MVKFLVFVFVLAFAFFFFLEWEDSSEKNNTEVSYL